MAKQYRKELSFQSGEISPRFLGRSDTDVYDKGLAVAENVFIDKRGGVFRRTGLEHIGQVEGNKARVFTLQTSRQRYYTIVIYHLKMLIIAAGARFLDDNLLSNGSFASGGTDWNKSVSPISSSVEFATGRASLIPEQNNQEIVKNGNFTQDGLDWTVRESHAQSNVTFANGQATLIPRTVANEFAGIAQQLNGQNGEIHTVNIKGEFGGNSLHIQVGNNEGTGEMVDIIATAPGSFSFTATTSPFWITLDCEYPNSFIQLDSVSVEKFIEKTAGITQQATVTALPTDEHVVVVSQAGREPIKISIGTFQGDEDIFSVVTTEHEFSAVFIPNVAIFWVKVEANGALSEKAVIHFVGAASEALAGGLGIEYDAPWTEDQLDEIHSIEVPQGSSIYFTHPNVPVNKISYDTALDIFVPLQEVVFVDPPPQWAGTNHPATGTHFQGRLWLGGTPSERQTIWASVSGSEEDFTVTADNDSSSLEFTLQEFGRIEWMLGTKNLLIGAENGEHIITSDGGVVTPKDFNIKQQSSFGSNNMQGRQVGEKVFYLTPDGRQLRAMSYAWQEDNWLSQDLTFSSEHITAPIGKFSSWAQHPFAIFFIVLEDGTAAAVTYDRTAETIGWTRLEMEGFKLLDMSSGRSDGRNETVSVGQRTPGFIDIEVNHTAKQFLDSYVSVFDAGGTNVITGLDHLEGLEVRPVVDGAVEPKKVVVGGQITTERTGFQLYAGMDFKSKIVTLPPDIPQAQIRSYKKRWNKVWALMLSSKQPIINGIRPPDRTPSTPMNTVEPNQTKHWKTVNLGWDDNGQITIEENLPVAMNVLAIYGEMGAESL